MCFILKAERWSSLNVASAANDSYGDGHEGTGFASASSTLANNVILQASLEVRPMLFQGHAKKISIRFVNGDARLSELCKALLTFLSPKDVCCLQVLDYTDNVEIQFLARPSKTDALLQTAERIAPNALIQVGNTTIVHAQSLSSRDDLAAERAHWEVPA